MLDCSLSPHSRGWVSGNRQISQQPYEGTHEGATKVIKNRCLCSLFGLLLMLASLLLGKLSLCAVRARVERQNDNPHAIAIKRCVETFILFFALHFFICYLQTAPNKYDGSDDMMIVLHTCCHIGPHSLNRREKSIHRNFGARCKTHQWVRRGRLAKILPLAKPVSLHLTFQLLVVRRDENFNHLFGSMIPFFRRWWTHKRIHKKWHRVSSVD